MSENIDNERGQTFTAQKPTADAAKLLPTCWNCLGTGILPSFSGGNSRCPICEGTGSSSKSDTSPQPAPPAEEPDFAALACQIGFEHDEEWSELEISYGGGGRNINRERLIEIIKTLAEKMYRLGLAARPKVEDGEVAAVVLLMRARCIGTSAYGSPLETSPDHDCHKAADLLERLAGDKAERERLGHVVEGMANQLRTTKSKLAEREADLRTKETQLAQAEEYERYKARQPDQSRQRAAKDKP